MRPPPPTDPYVSNSLIRFVSNGPERTINLAGDEPTRRHGCCCPSECNCLRPDSCAIGASFVQTVCGLNVPPAFPWHRRHARHCLPALLRVLSWVPWASVPHASGQRLLPAPRYCALLRLPSSVPVGLLLAPFRYLGLTRFSFVSLPARAGAGSSAGRVGQRAPGCCLGRSPFFRPLLPRRREALPSSRVTPLNTCPALRPRWCPACLP